MAWHTYGNRGYPTYTNVPAQEDGYGHGPKQPGKWYVVETTTIERFRNPGVRYTDFGDQEYNHGPSTLINPKYAPKYHQEGYEPDYGSDNENSSPPRHHGRESLVDKFRNKLNIKETQPVKTSNLSSPNKYQPASPTHNYPSEDAHSTKARNLSGPNKHQPTSPEHSYPREEAHMIKTKNMPGPNKYKSSNPEHNYPLEEAHLIRTKSLPGPNKYQPTSPMHNYPSKEAHLTRTKILSGPNKYQPTSPIQNYPSDEDQHVRTRNFLGPNNYQPISPIHNYPSDEDHLIKTRNLSGPNKYQPTNPIYNYPSDEDQLIGTRNLTGFNNNHPSIPGSKIAQFRRFSSPKNHWISAGPPMTHHPLTTVTNDINEALGFLAESMNYPPHSGQSRTEAFDNFSPHPQIIEHEWQYAKPTFAGNTNFRTNTIDSQEAIRKYQGTRVP